MSNLWRESGKKFLSELPNKNGLDWSERTNIIADLIRSSDKKYFYDFGCGECRLSSFVEKKKFYVGFDSENFSIYKNTNVISIDLNNKFPEIKNDGLAICSGILEYISDLDLFIFNLNKNFDTVIFSCLNKNINKTKNIFEKYFKEISLVSDTKNNPPLQSVFIAKR